MLKISLSRLNQVVRSKVKELRLLSPSLPDANAEELAMEGFSLTHEEVTKLESEIGNNLDDVDNRIRLLGWYQHNRHADTTCRAKHQRLALWFIENRPDHRITGLPFGTLDQDLDDNFAAAAELWKKQIERYSLHKRVLQNAAHFFLHADKQLAETCLSQALDLHPNDCDVLRDLALLYSLWEDHEEQAFATQQRLCQKPRSMGYFTDFTDLPRLAFEAKHFDEAQRMAEELIRLASGRFRHDWNYGNAINEAHVVLGLIALQHQDIAKASHHLEMSIDGVATPQTTSFGPDLSLAERLATEGARDCVLAYLDKYDRLCGPGKDEAFVIRSSVTSIGDPIDRKNRTQFASALLDHEFHVLSGPPYKRQRTHLAHAVEAAQRKLRSWRRRHEQAKADGNEVLATSAQEMQSIFGNHVRRLQTLTSS